MPQKTKIADWRAKMNAAYPTLTKEQKYEKILACAADFGHHSDLYWKESNELKSRGLIELKTTYTATGNRVDRWFLVKP